MSTQATSQPESKTYEAGCHCGYIKFNVTLSPPLPQNKPLQCDCSACRRFGYLLVYPTRDQVQWHGESWDRLSKYRFNTKLKDHLFCSKCGASIGIDFREFYAPKKVLGISANKDWNPSPPRIVKILTRKAYEGDLSSLTSHAQQVRIFNGIDLTALEYKPFHGIEKVEPAEDLSGMWYDLEQKENAEETPNKEDEDEKELAAVAVTA